MQGLKRNPVIKSLLLAADRRLTDAGLLDRHQAIIGELLSTVSVFELKGLSPEAQN